MPKHFCSDAITIIKLDELLVNRRKIHNLALDRDAHFDICILQVLHKIIRLFGVNWNQNPGVNTPDEIKKISATGMPG